jgi:hypothetical protein
MALVEWAKHVIDTTAAVCLARVWNVICWGFLEEIVEAHANNSLESVI